MSTPGELYACLYAREFPAQTVLRLRPELRKKPCVVMDGEPPLEQVCSLNGKARRMGVMVGMTRVEVETFSEVTLVPRSVSEETATKMALLECAGSFTPRVEEVTSELAFLCVLDITGTEKLFGPSATLVETLRKRVQALGITASVAVSRNFHAAICRARGMSSSISVIVIPAGEESVALALLPLSVLMFSEEHAATFALWGIRTLGMLAALPEKELIARMGQEGKRLRQLARGELPHLFQPIEPPFKLEEYRELDSPVEMLDSLLFVVGVMLEQLVIRATGRMLALASLTITLHLEAGASHTRVVRPALPTNDRQFWIKLLHLDLEAHPPQAAILSLKLTAEPGSTSKVQMGLFSPQLPEPSRLDVTLARIRAIVGEECVGRALLRDTHRPDAFRMEPFAMAAGTLAEITCQQQRVAQRQLRPPEKTFVTLQNERPTAFFLKTKRYLVEKAYGPWLASGDWWNPELWSLEEWDVVAHSIDGSLLCGRLVRDLARNGWEMVALYD
ncbi:MAG TPA: DNA polymerase Y family protein [Edaphobacter sp.]|uniref:DNA polymerase Y family protein n=1 Tax=Edaphobacter sp. TaxID=1934404 RepID=UPI002CED4B59|nr:DNA polymerase Y family protein [Edaphobacter sp.]HUZ96921.1 DNA polymerase Y family protein [Edaphobacter sp.]